MAAVAAARRLDFAECSVEMRLRWFVGSVAMRCVPGFDFGVSGSMSSVDSVATGCLEVVGSCDG